MRICMPPVVTETVVRDTSAQIENTPHGTIEIDFSKTVLISLAAERLIQQRWGDRRIRQIRKPRKHIS